jgi:hypothetical protein
MGSPIAGTPGEVSTPRLRFSSLISVSTPGGGEPYVRYKTT